MKFIRTLIALLACSTASFAQHLKILPEKPSVTDSILIEYDPAFFREGSLIECRAYFSGISSDELAFPKVSVIPLSKAGSYWKGYIYPVPVQATSIVITFTDSLGQRDTNNRSGYWSLFYENNTPLPGSWAGAGDLLYGEWKTENCAFHLGQNPDSAQAFFKRDVILHPEVKHSYMRQYLASFKTGTAETDQELKNELAYFSALPVLSESNLQTLRRHYLRLNDTLNANHSEREIFKRFPEGSWTPQVRSLPLLIRAGSSRNFNEQAKAYQEFKSSFLKTYDNTFANFAMNYRAARMLVYMVDHFSEEGTMNLWKNEVNQLTDVGKINAYEKGSQRLLEKSELQNKLSQAPLENKFSQFSLNSSQQVKDAEDLATLAIELWKKNADGPLQQNESHSMTPAEIVQHRNNELSEIMALLGSSLLKQNKIQDAITVLKESVTKNKYAEPETNELYIEALAKSGDINFALSESKKIIASGKSTRAIDDFYRTTSKDQNILSSLKEESFEKVKGVARLKLIREKCPNFSWDDRAGKNMTSESLKNKIVVITFWGSWCPPCILELKSIDAVVKKFKNDPEVIFLTVNEDDVRERALKIINQYDTQNHFAFDQKRKMIYALGVNGLPAQIIIDKKGDIRFRTSGLSSFNEQDNTTAIEAMISVLKELK